MNGVEKCTHWQQMKTNYWKPNFRLRNCAKRKYMVIYSRSLRPKKLNVNCQFEMSQIPTNQICTRYQQNTFRTVTCLSDGRRQHLHPIDIRLWEMIFNRSQSLFDVSKFTTKSFNLHSIEDLLLANCRLPQTLLTHIHSTTNKLYKETQTICKRMPC